MTNPSPSASVEKRDVIHLADLWPCGHERSPENTQKIGVAGVRCRKCRSVITARSYKRRKNKGADHD